MCSGGDATVAYSGRVTMMATFVKVYDDAAAWGGGLSLMSEEERVPR